MRWMTIKRERSYICTSQFVALAWQIVGIKQGGMAGGNHNIANCNGN